MNLNLIDTVIIIISSYVVRAVHKVLLLLAVLQEDPETNESLATIAFLVYVTK